MTRVQKLNETFIKTLLVLSAAAAKIACATRTGVPNNESLMLPLPTAAPPTVPVREHRIRSGTQKMGESAGTGVRSLDPSSR